MQTKSPVNNKNNQALSRQFATTEVLLFCNFTRKETCVTSQKEHVTSRIQLGACVLKIVKLEYEIAIIKQLKKLQQNE